MNFCLKDMQKIVDSGDTKMKFDYVCLDSLKEASKNSNEAMKSALKSIQGVEAGKIEEGHIFHLSDLHFY